MSPQKDIILCGPHECGQATLQQVNSFCGNIDDGIDLEDETIDVKVLNYLFVRWWNTLWYIFFEFEGFGLSPSNQGAILCDFLIMILRLWAFANTIGGQLGGNNTQNHGVVNCKVNVNQHMCKFIVKKRVLFIWKTKQC